MPETREQLIERIEKLEKELEAQTRHNFYREKDELVLTLLKQNTLRAKQAQQQLAKYDLHLQDGPVFVLAVEFCCQGVLPPRNELYFGQFLANNMIQDLFGQTHTVLTTRNGSAYYCVVNAAKGQVMPWNDIEHACETIIQTLQEQAEIGCIVCVSDPRDSIELLHGAYQEVEWLRRYSRFVDTKHPVLRYGTMCAAGGEGPAAVLHELRQSLQMKKYDAAQRQAQQVLDELQHSGCMGVDNYVTEIYRAVNPILDRLYEAARDGELDQDRGQAAARALRQADTMEALRAAVTNALRELVEGKSELEQDAPNWMGALMTELQSGFRNPQISVNYLADQVGITPVHLSRVFRKFQGVGLMDYVHQLRVEDAKRLIMEGYSVKDAMTLVGYTNQLTMTRAFKRLEGSTPGQYAPAARMTG